MSPDEIVPAVVIEVPDEQTQAVVPNPVASAKPDDNVAVLYPVDIPPPVVLEVPDPPSVVIAPKGDTDLAIVVSDTEEKIGVSSEVDGSEVKSVASRSRAVLVEGPAFVLFIVAVSSVPPPTDIVVSVVNIPPSVVAKISAPVVVVVVPDLVVVNPPVVVVVSDLFVVLSAITVIDLEIIVANLLEIVEVSFGMGLVVRLGIVVITFPVDVTVVDTSIVVPFIVVPLLIVSFSSVTFSVDCFRLAFGVTVLVISSSSPPKIQITKTSKFVLISLKNYKQCFETYSEPKISFTA